MIPGANTISYAFVKANGVVVSVMDEECAEVSVRNDARLVALAGDLVQDLDLPWSLQTIPVIGDLLESQNDAADGPADHSRDGVDDGLYLHYACLIKLETCSRQWRQSGGPISKSNDSNVLSKSVAREIGIS